MKLPIDHMTVAFGLEDARGLEDSESAAATAATVHTAKSLRQKRAFSCGEGKRWGQPEA